MDWQLGLIIHSFVKKLVGDQIDINSSRNQNQSEIAIINAILVCGVLWVRRFQGKGIKSKKFRKPI